MPTLTGDQITAYTRKLMPDIQNLWKETHPVLESIFDNLKAENAEGPYTAFDIEVGNIGEGQQIITGNERLSYTGNDILAQGQVYLSRYIHTVRIPLIKLQEASPDAAGIMSISKRYPENAMETVRLGLLEQLLTGAVSLTNNTRMSCFPTLNGDKQFTVNPTVGAQYGMLLPKAKTSQTETLFGLAREGTGAGYKGWYNQFGQISSFAVDGKSVMRKTYNECRVRSAGRRPPKYGITNTVFYENYYSSLQDQVRVVTQNHESKGDKGAMASTGLAFEEALIFSDPIMDDLIANFTTAAAAGGGQMYLFHPDDMVALRQGRANGPETDGNFHISDFRRAEGQDAIIAEITLVRGFAMRNLKGNGVIIGGNNA